MHFSVAVITKTGTQEEVDKLLAPYDEALEVEPYISMTKAELIETGKRLKRDTLKKLKPFDSNDMIVLNLKTDEEFYDYMKDDSGLYDKEGNELSTYNPNAQWDWYETGGRWKNFLKRADGTRHDSLRIKDCDFSPKEEDIKYFSELWDQVVEGKDPESERKFILVASPDYYRSNYGTRENYIKLKSSFRTAAVLFSNGTWLEPEYTQDGEREWERDYEKNVLERLNPDEFITIVDCHI